MTSTKSKARRAGLLYLFMAILMIVAFMYIPGTLVVSGDAAATAHNITESTTLYRAGILIGMISQMLFLVLALLLYDLFRDVDRWQGRLIVVLISVGVAVEIVRLGFRLAPLVLLSEADFLSVFTRPQLEAAALGALRLGNGLGQLDAAFWGLWLIPFGNLVIKSRYFPKLFGILLYATGAAYLATFITSTIAPDYVNALGKVMFPLYFGELGIVFWMAIMGAKEPAFAGTRRHGDSDALA